MAGYSGTPLPKKLGIKPGATVAFADAPADFAATLGELPEGVTVKARARRARRTSSSPSSLASALGAALAGARTRDPPDGGLWIAWPKRSSGVETDITEDVVRELALAGGLVDNKVCAIDETWSGLRLVYRLRDRPKR